MTTNPTGPELDLLYGLAAIGEHIGLTARQAEHLVAKRDLPTFKLGATICSRRSTLAAHFAAQEKAARSTSAISPRPRNRQPGRALGRPASVVIGAAAIGDRLKLDVATVTELDAARAIPTYIAGGLLCALASELDIYLAKGDR